MNKTLIVFILFAFQFAHSQDVLTFADCLSRALTNNLALKSAAFDEKAAVYQRRASFGKLLPSVYGEFENRNSWGKEIDSDTNLFVNEDLRNNEGTLNAYFTLFSGFSNLASIMAAKQELEINRTNIQRIRNEISIDVARRFITILFLQEIITANEEQIKSSEKQLELAELKFNSGVIAESEVFKIKSQKASEELRLLTTQNQLNENWISLKQLMNMPLDTEVTLIQPDLKLNENVVLDLDETILAERAVDIHPLYKISLLEERLAKNELTIARAPTYPTLTMRLLYRSNYSTTDFDNIPFSTQLDENTSKGIRFYLTIPIFSQFNNYGKLKAGKMRLM
ncbi:MAG TPA: TolC family protein, partial [Flavobacterium sp.]